MYIRDGNTNARNRQQYKQVKSVASTSVYCCYCTSTWCSSCSKNYNYNGPYHVDKDCDQFIKPKQVTIAKRELEDDLIPDLITLVNSYL